MTTILWDTNGTEIVKTLSSERRAAGALASGLALTLVVVCDEDHADEAQQAATSAASAHPCRLLVVVRRRVEADDRLDAEVQVGGRLGANEAVMMRMYGRLSLHAESVVLPLLASDAPVVTWWHGVTPDRLAHDALGVLASRRVTDALTDAKADGDSLAALKRRAKDYAPGDTDLAWTRTTPWRALLASAFDDMADTAVSAEVQAEAGNPSAALVAGWLTSRLGVRVKRTDTTGPGITGVEVKFASKDVLRIDRPDGYLATLSRTGISDRQLPLKRRELGELLAEELRRLDADQPYADALSAVTGARDLDSRPPMRTLVWKDPETKPRPKPTATGAAKKSSTATKKPATSASAKKSAPSEAAVKAATRRKAAAVAKTTAGTRSRTAKKVAARKERKAGQGA